MAAHSLFHLDSTVAEHGARITNLEKGRDDDRDAMRTVLDEVRDLRKWIMGLLGTFAIGAVGIIVTLLKK